MFIFNTTQRYVVVCLAGLGLANVQGRYIIVAARTVQWFVVLVMEVKMFCVCVCEVDEHLHLEMKSNAFLVYMPVLSCSVRFLDTQL